MKPRFTNCDGGPDLVWASDVQIGQRFREYGVNRGYLRVDTIGTCLALANDDRVYGVELTTGEIIGFHPRALVEL